MFRTFRVVLIREIRISDSFRQPQQDPRSLQTLRVSRYETHPWLDGSHDGLDEEDEDINESPLSTVAVPSTTRRKCALPAATPLLRPASVRFTNNWTTATGGDEFADLSVNCRQLVREG